MNAFFVVTSCFKNIINFFKKGYTLDLRALSLMRIGVGLVLLIDLVIRSLSIKAFFTDDGVLPVSILKQYNWNPCYFSFHTLSGSLWWEILLFVMNGLCVCLLIVGYRTRLLTFICWVFLVSLQNRNPFILQGGDELLRLILLWGVFLPWGHRYSIHNTHAHQNTYFTGGNIGYLLLIASVYFFSALYKTSPEWHSEGTAVYYALSLDQIRMPLGSLLFHYPTLMRGLTHAVYCIELVAPILMIVPFYMPRIRLIGILCIALLHLGIAATLYVGLFYIIGIVSLFGLLPSVIMDIFELKILNHFRGKFTKRKRPISTGDMVSPDSYTCLPNGNVRFLLNTFKIGFVFFIIIFCLLLNLSQIKKFPYTLNNVMLNIGSILRLEQSWTMFSPSVFKDDGFYVYSGYSTKKKFIDILHQTDYVSFKKPDAIVSEYESDRWRKFGENYLFNYNNYMRPYYCRYMLRKWNEEHPDKYINELSIFYMKEVSLPNYQTKPLEKMALCTCQDK